jgi:SAM-dependent methyltransferase
MRSLDCQTEYWNDIGPTKTFAHPVNFELLARHLRPASRILDYGCGYGRVLGELRAAGYHDVVGVDPAPAMIGEARSRQPGIELHVLSEPPTLPFADETFDAVLFFAVLTCIPTDDGQRGVIAEATRVLRRGGLLYVSDLWLQTDERNRARYAAGHVKFGTWGVFELPDGVVLRHQEPSSMVALTAGYDTLALEDVVHDTMNGHRAAGFQWLGSKSGGSTPLAGVQ